MPLNIPVPQLLINPFKGKYIKALTPNLSKIYEDSIKQSALYQHYEKNILSKVVILYTQMLYNQIQTYKNAQQIIEDAIQVLEENNQNYIELCKNTFSRMKDYFFIDLDPKQDILLDDNTQEFIQADKHAYYATQFTNIYSQKFTNKKLKRNYIKVALPNRTCMFIQPPARTLPTYDSVVLLCEYIENYIKQQEQDIIPEQLPDEIDEPIVQEDVLADRDEGGTCSVCECEFQSYNEHILSAKHQAEYNKALQYKVGKGLNAVSCKTYLKLNIPLTNQKCYRINQDAIIQQMLQNTQLLYLKQLQIDNKCINKYKQLEEYQEYIDQIQQKYNFKIEQYCDQLLENKQKIEYYSDIFSDTLLNKQKYLVNKNYEEENTCFVYIKQYSIEKIKTYSNQQLKHLISFVQSIIQQALFNQQQINILYIDAKQLEKELSYYQLNNTIGSNLQKLGLFIFQCLQQLNIEISNNDYPPRILLPDKVITQQQGMKLQQLQNSLEQQKFKFIIKKYKTNINNQFLDNYQGSVTYSPNIISLQARNIILNSLHAGIQSQNSQSMLNFVDASQYYLQQICNNKLDTLPFNYINYYLNQ